LEVRLEEEASGELPLAVLPNERNALGEIGDYELQEMIGRGGMGVVFKARQISTHRIVAVKLLPGGIHATEEIRRRFQQELSAVARLQHPNIVPTFELSECDGQLLCVMEYVPGQDLARLTRGRPINPHSAARYVLIAAQTIHYAHTQGVLHRDLKPSNILVDPKDQLRITDFGLAKELDLETNLTATGQILGSPGYLPPEQVSVRSGTIGPHSDVYSLGAILYYLLTGRPPFLATTVADTLREVVEQYPVPPKRLNASVDKHLEAICLRCLEKDPRRRYASAQKLAEDLEAYLENRPVLARLPGIGYRVWHWRHKHPVSSWLILGVGVGVPAMVGLMFSLSKQVGSERSARGDLQRQVQAVTLERDRQFERAEWLAYASHLNHAARAWENGNPAAARKLLDDTQEDKRGWEYSYLQSLFHPELGAWTGHKKPLNAIACSRDGSKVASAGTGRIIRVWEPATGQSITTLSGHRTNVLTLAFLRENWLASGDEDGVIHVWDMIDGGIKRRWEWRSTAVECLAQGQTRDQVIAAYRNGFVCVWDLASNGPIKELAAHVGSALAVAVPPVGLPPATGGQDGNVVLWDVNQGTRLSIFRGHQGMVEALDYTPDGSQLVSGGHDGLVIIWDRETGRQARVLRGHRAAVRAVQVSSDGEWIASAGSDCTVILWKRESGEQIHSLSGHSSGITDLAFHPNGHRLFSASLDSTVLIWDVDRTPIDRPLFLPSGVAKMFFSPDSRWFITTGSDRTLVKWTCGPVVSNQLFAPEENKATGIAINPDSRSVLTGNFDGTVRILDAVAGDLKRSYAGHTGAVRALAISRDSSKFASGGDDKTVRLWSLSSPGALHIFNGHAGRIIDVRFSPDGDRIYSAGWNDSVRIWDAKTGHQISEFKGIAGGLSSMDLSLDGCLLGVSFSDTAEIWNAQTGAILNSFKGHASYVRSVAFSANGQRLVTSAEDKTVRIWDISSGQTLYVFPGLLSPFNKVMFSPDGTKLLSASRQGVVYLWDSAPVKSGFAQLISSPMQ